MANLEFEDIGAFSTFLLEKAEQQILAMNESASVAAEILFEHALGIYGEHPPLAELAEATKEERSKIPGITTDDPLFRTGSLLRNKVEYLHTPSVREGLNDVAIAAVGSPEIINLYHEVGYVNARTGRPVPPRPVFMITGQETGEHIAELFSAEMKRVFS
jgi:hypothetical protein